MLERAENLLLRTYVVVKGIKASNIVATAVKHMAKLTWTQKLFTTVLYIVYDWFTELIA